jgi:hypothetical protein
MWRYVIECITGLQGSSSYRTYEEAAAAAQWRTNCTGLEWHVKELLTRY